MIKSTSDFSEKDILILANNCIGLDFQGDSKSISQLVALAKTKQVRNLVSKDDTRRQFTYLLKSNSPKVRKNTARFLGECGIKDDEQMLINALSAEKTHFVIPSLILALGALGGDEAIKSLKNIQLKWREVSDEELLSHKEKILSAANNALNKLEPAQKLAPDTLPPLNYFLFPADGCLDLLINECKEKSIAGFSIKNKALTFNKTSFEKLSCLRCFESAMIPIASFRADPKSISIAETIHEHSTCFVDLLKKQYPNSKPGYRIEIKSLDHRTRSTIAKKLANLIDSDSIVTNSTSNYLAEMLVFFDKDFCHIYCALSYPKDERFSYREKSIAASMKGHIAANIMQFFRPYTSPGSSVVDPVCGSGTLLFERAILSDIPFSLGVDIERRAITAARNNCKIVKTKFENVKTKFDFVLSDATKFTPNKKFDELIANLPFGARVGDKDSSDALHVSIVNRLDDYLNPSGVALLYTTRKTIIKESLQNTSWSIVAERKFEMGGLSPTAFVVKRK